MINQNMANEWVRDMILPRKGGPARHQSRFCPHKEPLGPNPKPLDCVRSGMDEVILTVSERSLETQKDRAIVQVRVLEKHPTIRGIQF